MNDDASAPRGVLQRRAAFGLAFVLFASACTDATLDLTERKGITGGAGMTGSSGAAGEDGRGGESGAGTGENAMIAPDFCENGLGECLFREGELSCTGDVGQTAVTVVNGIRARLVVDMTNASELKAAFEICDPSGYVLNIGDSPSDNGGGGDAGDFQHDAEIMLYDADLTAWSSDLGYEQKTADTGYHPRLITEVGYVAEQGCSVRTLRIGDSYIVDGDDSSIHNHSPVALRINPSTDEQGPPDARWYVGLNRVVSDSIWDARRVGTGMQALRLCFHVPAVPEPPRTGP